MESCSDSMYCLPPKMTTACSPKCAFLCGATQFLDITLLSDCIDEEMAARLTFFQFANSTEWFKCALPGPRFRWRWAIQHPVQHQWATVSSQRHTKTAQTLSRGPNMPEFCGVVLWSCWVSTFWALQKKPKAKQPSCVMSEALSWFSA